MPSCFKSLTALIYSLSTVCKHVFSITSASKHKSSFLVLILFAKYLFTLFSILLTPIYLVIFSHAYVSYHFYFFNESFAVTHIFSLFYHWVVFFSYSYMSDFYSVDVTVMFVLYVTNILAVTSP
jgi:hypothetical protein